MDESRNTIVLLAAVPGGTRSNLIVHAAEVDRALSVSFTSLSNTALSNTALWITTPLLLKLSFNVFDYGDFPLGELIVSVAVLTMFRSPIALSVGYGFARGTGIDERQSSTIPIEMGLQNSAFALTVATSVLGDSELAIIPDLYGVWMLFTGFGFAFGMKKRSQSQAELSMA